MTALSTETTPLPQDRILIRHMRQEDLEQVRAIDKVSFTLPWPESAYNYELNENPLSLLWVAEYIPVEGPSKIVGMIVVWMILDEAHIATIATLPDYRRQGIAQHLLVEALKEAIGRGGREATLEVRTSNIAAQKLYQKFRFEVAGNRLRYYRDNNEDAVIMTMYKLGTETLNWLDSGAWKGE